MFNTANIVEVEYSFNLCPVCGLPSNSTSIICPTHVVITINSKGEIIDYADIVIRKY